MISYPSSVESHVHISLNNGSDAGLEIMLLIYRHLGVSLYIDVTSFVSLTQINVLCLGIDSIVYLLNSL